MIRADKVNNALWAMNGLLLQSHALACNHHDHEVLAEVFDFAEYLPNLMASPEDHTDEFRYFLEGISRAHPAFQIVLERFDADSPPAGWWG